MSDWPRVAAILERALELPPAERDRFIEDAAGDDQALLDELRALVASHARAESASFIETPLAAARPDLVLNLLAPGERIGPYEILEEAGRGGMGIVYRARDARLGRDVAVKCVAEGAGARERERLAREARLAARVSHPAVATVYALEERDDQLYLISEFVGGETLSARLARGPLSAGVLTRAARAIAGGLAAAHRDGVVHGDLKPSNIVISESGDVKLLDFGLAGERSEDTPIDASVMAGTPGYVAPEQLRGAPADARADVFAFGVLLFEMATGRHPFAGDRGALLEAALAGRRPFDAPDVPPALAPIIERCLAADPAERYASGAELARALETHPAPRASRSLWWYRVHQRTVAGFAVAAPVLLWLVRHDIARPWGSALFVLTVAGATAVLVLRLSADFVARERPAELGRHVANTRRRVVSAELTLDAVLLTAATALGGAADEAAALLAGLAVASILALTVIEPSTTRAALELDAR